MPQRASNSFIQLSKVPVGFQADGVLTFRVVPPYRATRVDPVIALRT
jgi:hypothetical protein